MLDLKTTDKISRGKLKEFTFVLKNKRALQGFITKQFVAKNKQQAITMLQQNCDLVYDENNGDKLIS
tara:strand:- start:2847 stop:3047 length:201 start_codon:yes stop_codon:yes gene_type:complete